MENAMERSASRPFWARRASIKKMLCLVALNALFAAASGTSHVPPPLLEISPPVVTEELLRRPGIVEINLTLVGGNGWAPALGVDTDVTTHWLYHSVRGTSGSAQPLGWEVTVAPHLRPEHVVRVEGVPNMLQLLLMGFDGHSGRYPALDVWFAEAVMISAPYWATADNVSAVPPYANLTVAPSVPRVQVLGELADGTVVRVADMRRRAHEVLMVLDGCDWEMNAGRPGSAAFAALSAALVGPSHGVGMVAGEAGGHMDRQSDEWCGATRGASQVALTDARASQTSRWQSNSAQR